MRNIFLAIALLLTISTYAQSDSTALATPSSDVPETVTTTDSTPEAMFDSANQAFIGGQYPMAVATYEAILNKGVHSPKLYYNLGNAYFQQGQIGKAILNYTRAKNLNPTDDDIAYNLELAKAKTKDKIDAVPQFFLVRWVASISELLNSNWWAVMAIIFFAITACGVVAWLVVNKMALRKLGFFVALLSMIFTVFSIGFSISAASDEYDGNQAVIINTAAPIKSSPSTSGKDLFILHEGTAVRVLQQLDGFSEIELTDGNKGWIATSAIELV